jgi:uncharacterized membrane protein
MNDATPWYRSPVYIAQIVTIASAILALSPKLATALHLASQSDIKEVVEAVFTLIALVAGVVGENRRRKSQLQPITLTAHAASVHPATIQAERARMASETESGAASSIPASKPLAVLLFAALILSLIFFAPVAIAEGEL